MGLSGFLFVLFVGLKILGYISWSWWWITSPLWITFIVWVIVIVLGVGLVATLTKSPAYR